VAVIGITWLAACAGFEMWPLCGKRSLMTGLDDWSNIKSDKSGVLLAGSHKVLNSCKIT